MSDHGSDAWKEAVATALMAQNRSEEAAEYYMRLAESGPLPERTILTAARWGWPFTMALPVTSSLELLEQACTGAALSSSEPLLMDLHHRGVALDVVWGGVNLANAAARAGHVCILKALREHNINLTEPQLHVHNTPLWEAAKYGQCDAARFLLRSGARPDIPDDSPPADIAARMGNVDILRLFHRHTPTFWTSRTSSGELRTESAIRRGLIDVITFFVKEAGVDINETNETGLTALHIAMESDQMELAAVIIALGAEIHRLDSSGQTALERAASHGLLIPARISQPMSMSSNPAQLREHKILLAKKILESLRDLHIQKLVITLGNSIDGSSAEEKVQSVRIRWLAAGIEDTLSEIWARSLSTLALEWYAEKIMGSHVGTTYKRLHLIAQEAGAATTDTRIYEGSPEQLSTVRNIVEAIMPLASRNQSDVEKIIRSAVQDIPSADLRELKSCLGSREGLLYVAGVKAKGTDELIELLRFARGQGWQSWA